MLSYTFIRSGPSYISLYKLNNFSLWGIVKSRNLTLFSDFNFALHETYPSKVNFRKDIQVFI
jgi:hypothetical protein